MTTFKDRYLKAFENRPLKIFDLGSLDVNGSYREIFEHPGWVYKGLDVEAGKNVDIVLKNNYHWKELDSDSVDVMISGQAFEHIEFFWITMLEVARILKPGGLCCIIAPSAGYEHRYPVDCWRFYPDGFRALARFAGLLPLEVFAQWEADPADTDDSGRWKDAVLIAEKPAAPLLANAWRDVKRRLLHGILMSWI